MLPNVQVQSFIITQDENMHTAVHDLQEAINELIRILQHNVSAKARKM